MDELDEKEALVTMMLKRVLILGLWTLTKCWPVRADAEERR